MVKCSDDGWINKGLFLEFGKKCASWLPKDDKRPHVLLMDGHGSHVFSVDFINLMKANNINVFCFPHHTTHWLQPTYRGKMPWASCPLGASCPSSIRSVIVEALTIVGLSYFSYSN